MPDGSAIEAREAPNKRDDSAIEAREAPNTQDDSAIEAWEAPNTRDGSAIEAWEAPNKQDDSVIEAWEAPNTQDGSAIEAWEAPNKQDDSVIGAWEPLPLDVFHVVLNRNAVPSCSPRVPSLGRALPWDSRVPPPPSRSWTATRSRHGLRLKVGLLIFCALASFPCGYSCVKWLTNTQIAQVQMTLEVGRFDLERQALGMDTDVQACVPSEPPLQIPHLYHTVTARLDYPRKSSCFPHHYKPWEASSYYYSMGNKRPRLVSQATQTVFQVHVVS